MICGNCWVGHCIGSGIVTDISDGYGGEKPGKRDGTGDQLRKTSIAVALKYGPDSEYAPKVVAGGRGAVAEQILQVAFAAGVKVREDADLAEMLSTIDVESEIPVEAFATVAEILAYVYRLNGTLPEFANSNAEPATPDISDAPT